MHISSSHRINKVNNITKGKKRHSCGKNLEVEKVENLINLWGKKEILYNASLPDYLNKEKKNKVVSDISSELGIPIGQVMIKIKNLKS